MKMTAEQILERDIRDAAREEAKFLLRAPHRVILNCVMPAARQQGEVKNGPLVSRINQCLRAELAKGLWAAE